MTEDLFLVEAATAKLDIAGVVSLADAAARPTCRSQ
jgi:hypothetical protein